MIVKNESRIIKRLLHSVLELIDEYCICDTGSTDDTMDIIRTFFLEHQIPGVILEEPFQDFGYNRSVALKACDVMESDYLLLLDADMILWRNPDVSIEEIKTKISAYDMLYFFQGNDAFYYKNARMVKNKKGFKYWGVTHEYVESPAHTNTGCIDKNTLFIKDVGDGGSKQNKFLRDIKLLRKGLETEPNNVRYTFYLANSLKDSNQKKQAVDVYKKRIQLGGWIEEVWQSYYSMGKCLLDLERKDEAIVAWLEGYDAFPQRIENLYEIMQHYRVRGKHKLAFMIYELADKCRKEYPERDYLFLQNDVYQYKLDYEFSICGYYYNPKNQALDKLSMELLKYPHMEEGIANNILSNYKFYSPCAHVKDTRQWENYGLGIALKKIGKDISSQKFVSSTPTFCRHPTDENKMYVNVRFVNYRINEEGGYENEEYIETKNVLAELELDLELLEWKINRECLLDYQSSFDNKYVGLEDLRLYCHSDGKLYYTANRGLSTGHMVVEHGWINRHRFSTEDIQHIDFVGKQKIEKNWVMFLNEVDDSIGFVYHWYPLTIGKVEKALFTPTHTLQTPYLFKFIRGSTNGVVIQNEIWFLCHAVSYENRRFYYHVMVVLDKSTFALKKYSHFFTFEKEKVEYALGMKYIQNDEFLIGYSVMDRETKFVTLKKAWFQEKMCII